MKFTYEAYRHLISLLIRNGYSIESYSSWNKSQKPCILRHDVDIDVEKAASFAEFESEVLGGDRGATYFFLITSDFYNIHSKKNISLLKHIRNCGHDIGLHFDETVYKINDDIEILQKKILEEKDILSNVIGDEITAVSMHRPSNNLLEMNLEIPSMINSYANIFFRDFKYVSDSRMAWREDVLSIVQSTQFQKLHILTHPFWYEVEERSLEEKLLCFLRGGNEDRYDILNHNFKNLETEVKKNEVIYGISR